MALTLNIQSESTPYPGVTISQYLTTSPNTKVTVASIDLCESGIHVDATAKRDWFQSTGSWANNIGVQVAINGDFHTYAGGSNGYYGPPRVYGNAVGNGQAWPEVNTGIPIAYEDDWYHHKYGWIAFAHDRIYYTYPEWVKLNPSQFSNPIGGWQPTTVNPDIPPGTLALISGFSALVVEGEVIQCISPTHSACFPDRADMRGAHYRSAVGFTEDRQNLLLVTVAGNGTSGMYGSQLANLMGQLGAFYALNVDGGGSSQLWANGYVNFPSESYRSISNHLGVYAGTSSGMPSRPGHCESSTPCQELPPEGGVIDNDSECFHAFGNPAYWRDESQGHNGGLIWTNAGTSNSAYNWAWWQLNLEIGGEYELEYYATPEFAVFDQVSHTLWANGIQYDFTVDQSQGSGWTSLGTYEFSTSGEQSLALYDNGTGSIGSNQHVVADAIRLTRIGGWCGDGSCDDDENCSTCPNDCTEPTEIPENGIDDDCDGATDHSPECNGVVTEDWCVDNFLLGICVEGFYDEVPCNDLGKVCSESLLQCLDIECIEREDDSWCDGTTAMNCTDGDLEFTDCDGDCQAGDCLPVTDSGDISEPDSSTTRKSWNCSTSSGHFSEVFYFLGFLIVGMRIRQKK